VGHAYLFSGPRGCGKTTVARLLAKALNCLSPVKDGGDGASEEIKAGELRAYEPCCECKNCLAIAAGESLDVIEIDGASNNSVDEVRELKSHVTLAPFSSQYKVYIVDEVHMLSISAFNALLKTLEEPPAYVVFILATTEAHKVPVTIRSRCQHIPFHRIGARDIYERLARVSAVESLAYQTEALWEISRQADGALRDALSMLEQVANLGRTEISLSDVEMTLGQGSRPALERWVAGWRGGESETFLELDRMLAGGASPQRFLEELFSLVRNLWLTARWGGVLASLDTSDQEKEYLKKEAPLWEPRKLASIMDFLSELLPQVRMGLRIDVLVGLLMAKMVRLKEGPEEPREAARDDSLSTLSVLPTLPARRRTEGSAQNFTAPAAPSGEKAEVRTHAEPPAPEEGPSPKTRSAPKAAPAPRTLSPAETETPAPFPFSPPRDCPKEQWDAALDALRDQELVLYCALLEAVPFLSDKKAETDAEGGGAALILDIADRYCYEVLRLDRNRAFLKNGLTPSFEGTEIVFRHGDLWVSCRGAARSAEGSAKKTSGRRSSPKRESFSGSVAASDSSIPVDEPKISEAEQPEPSRGSREEGVPFEGLVEEASRWLRGDIVLVRRGGESESEEDGIEEISSLESE
jgi:DNA polymerase-3 subunit gamma/tau